MSEDKKDKFKNIFRWHVFLEQVEGIKYTYQKEKNCDNGIDLRFKFISHIIGREHDTSLWFIF